MRELLKAGFRVRAGVRDVKAAEASVEVAEAYGLLTTQQIKQLQIVPFDLSDVASMKKAIGGARKVELLNMLHVVLLCHEVDPAHCCMQVVCAVGAPESEALNVSAPKKIDGDGTIAL